MNSKTTPNERSETNQNMKTRTIALRLLHISGFVLAGLAVPSRVQADVISDWNDIAVPLIRTAPNITATRQLALVHVAQFEAVNAVVGKYTPYVVNLAAPGASPEAATPQRHEKRCLFKT
jgi:hypothetical protein